MFKEKIDLSALPPTSVVESLLSLQNKKEIQMQKFVPVNKAKMSAVHDHLSHISLFHTVFPSCSDIGNLGIFHFFFFGPSPLHLFLHLLSLFLMVAHYQLY